MLNEIIDYVVPKELSASDESIGKVELPFLKWNHNPHNSLASSIPHKLSGMRNEVIKESMRGFKTIKHRLEFVTKISGITFINDSKATNVNATWYALETMFTDVVLILGGVDKGNDYEELKSLVKQKVTAIVCLGKNTEKIQTAFTEDVDTIVVTTSMQEAVHMAYSLAPKNATVLLSPACASFDLFKNYEDRGKQFKQAVKEL